MSIAAMRVSIAKSGKNVENGELALKTRSPWSYVWQRKSRPVLRLARGVSLTARECSSPPHLEVSRGQWPLGKGLFNKGKEAESPSGNEIKGSMKPLGQKEQRTRACTSDKE